MKNVVDSSTVLAICLGEEGAKEARQPSQHAMISAVNLNEVYVKAIQHNNFEYAQSVVSMLSLTVVPFTEEQAVVSAHLSTKTYRQGISFADRACLSLALITRCPVVTGDRAWQSLDIDIEIIQFRPSVN